MEGSGAAYCGCSAIVELPLGIARCETGCVADAILCVRDMVLGLIVQMTERP